MTKMDRRTFLRAAGTGGAGLAVSSLAAPAIAQSAPEIRWRMTSSFPKSLDTLFAGADSFSRALAELSDNRFQVQVFAAGEIVPGLQAADAVSNGTVECAQTASYYYIGKDDTFAFGTTIPFGLNSRQQNAWMYEGGGIDLMNEFYAKYNIFALPAGNTGAQMGGWFRKEIKTVDDLKGVKMRIAGITGRVLSKLGVVPQQIAGGDIYPALEKGTVDAAEWVGPYDDEKLGLYKVAKYYYYPGWWEGQAMLHVFINKQKWEALPKTYKAMVRAAAHTANEIMTARYDKQNPAAVKKLLAEGAELRAFSPEILEACYRTSHELYAEVADKNANFKKVWEQYRQFRADQYLWWQVAEFTFDAFQVRAVNRRT